MKILKDGDSNECDLPLIEIFQRYEKEKSKFYFYHTYYGMKAYHELCVMHVARLMLLVNERYVKGERASWLD